MSKKEKPIKHNCTGIPMLPVYYQEIVNLITKIIVYYILYLSCKVGVRTNA